MAKTINVPLDFVTHKKLNDLCRAVSASQSDVISDLINSIDIVIFMKGWNKK